MKKKALIVILMIVIVLIIISINTFQETEITNFEECAAAGYPVMESYPRQCKAGGKTFVEDIKIGGETDEHGCLSAAGYSFNSTINACLREWELGESQRRVAKLAVEEVGSTKGLTIVEVEVLRCPGCFVVKLKKDIYTEIEVSISDWAVHEAIEKNYCSEESRNADVCITITLYQPVCGYPLEKTFSHACFACINSEVEYWINGECPE